MSAGPRHPGRLTRRSALAAGLLLPGLGQAQDKPAPKLDVHYVPTPMPVVHKMLQMAELRPGNLIYDLGCGDGRIVVTAAKEHGARGIGIDLDPTRIAEAQANAREAGVSDRTRFLGTYSPPPHPQLSPGRCRKQS